MYEIKLKKIQEYKIYAFIRSIGSSGWKDKTNIRRVQISGFNVSHLPVSKKDITSMIIGVESLFDKDLFVIWNIYNYGSHEKNRSCYVNVSSLFQAFLKGYFTTTDANQRVWISDEYHLDTLLNEYLAYNYCSLGD